MTPRSDFFTSVPESIPPGDLLPNETFFLGISQRKCDVPGLNPTIRMSGAPIPDLRQAARFVDVLLKPNRSEGDVPPEVAGTQLVSVPTPHSPQDNVFSTTSYNSSEGLFAGIGGTPNPFYFYRVSPPNALFSFRIILTNNLTPDK